MSSGKKKGKAGKVDIPAAHKESFDYVGLLSPLIQGFVALSLTILLYCILAIAITRWYHPDISHALLLAKQLLISDYGCHPKPVDRALYSAAIIFFPAAMFVLFPILRRFVNRASEPALRKAGLVCIILACAAVLIIAVGGFLAPNPCGAHPENSHDNISPRNLEFYFINSFVYDHFPVYAFLLFPAVLLYLLYRERIPKRIFRPIRITKSILVYGGCAALASTVFFMSAFSFPYSYENKYDFNAVFYSVIQVSRGVPMLVNHFTNTYGLYPHFVAPLLKIFGLSILSFSGIMGFLLVICYFCLVVFLRKMVRSPLLILLGFTTFLSNCYLYCELLGAFDPYFAMGPIRWILPFLLLLFAVCYVQNRSRILYYASFVFFAAGILWCPDFGMLTFLSLIAFYSYLEFERNSIVGVALRTALHVVIASISIVVVFGLFSLCIRIGYGTFPDIGLLFSTMKVFAIIGSQLLPTPQPLHPWMLVALIYACGIAISVYHIVNKSVKPKAALIFLVTAIGVTSFQYYLGRSHNWNLTSSAPWAIILLTIFADYLLGFSRRYRLFIIPGAIVLFALSYSLFNILDDSGEIVAAMYETNAKLNDQTEQEAIQNNGEVIRNLTRENEPVLIFSAPPLNDLYYLFSHTTAAINPGIGDLFLKSDNDRIARFLAENTSTPVFLDAATFQLPDLELPVMLASYYNAEPVGGTMLALTKKQGSSGPSLAAADPAHVLHVMPGNDPRLRAAEMQGSTGPIHLGSRFAIQVWFKPADHPPINMIKWQTVFSNEKPGSGITLAQEEARPDHYAFFMSGNSLDIPVNVGKWNYLAIEIDGTTLRLFKDGMPAEGGTLKSGYVDSDQPFYIGDYKMQGGVFWGDIREIEITQRLPGEKEYAAAWKKAEAILGPADAQASAGNNRNLRTP